MTPTLSTDKLEAILTGAAKATDDALIAALSDPLGYEVDDAGNVYSHSHWRGTPTRRMMAQSINASGYPSVRMIVGGKRVHVAVHRLVALRFHGARPMPTHEVRHLDGNPMNNAAGNLAWGTRAENAADRTQHGRSKGAENGAKSAGKIMGERAGNAKLTDEQARQIIVRHAAGERPYLIAKDYPHVSKVTVERVAGGKSFRHLRGQS